MYELQAGHNVTIDVETSPDARDRDFVFAYLAVLNTRQEADDAVFELVPDKYKLDLDLLCKLKGKKVTLMVERYGFKGEFLEYDFVNKEGKAEGYSAELDFAVENQTGKTLLVFAFVYQKHAKGSWIGATEERDDMTIWRYDKTKLLTIPHGETGIIDVDTIVTQRDRSYVRGYLAVFGADQQQLADAMTYELLEPQNKLNLGEFSRLAGKKVVLDVENYGTMQDLINYTTKPTKSINFNTIKRPLA